MIKMIVDLVIFKRCTERRRDAAGYTESLMAVIENMQESKSGVFANGW